MAAALQGHDFGKTNRDTEWLRRVAELLMPEMGWPARVADRFANTPPALRSIWLNHRLTIAQRRAERLKQFLDVLPSVPDTLLTSRLGLEFTPTADMLADTSGSPSVPPG